jgi:Ca2+-binding RTX toxin-like protein
MSGGAGDDVYLVENLQDTVVENPGQGIDTVISSAKSHALSANVENLTLTGKNAKTGTGNALDNLITLSNSNDRVDGGAGNDIIVAGSGAGRLTGGPGHDMFVFSAGGQDQVMDFHIGEDLIDLRPLMQKVGYSGGDPIADRFLAITPDSSDGLIVSARLTPNGSLQGIANLIGVAPDELRIGLDLLWDDNGNLV